MTVLAKVLRAIPAVQQVTVFHHRRILRRTLRPCYCKSPTEWHLLHMCLTATVTIRVLVLLKAMLRAAILSSTCKVSALVTVGSILAFNTAPTPICSTRMAYCPKSRSCCTTTCSILVRDIFDTCQSLV